MRVCGLLTVALTCAALPLVSSSAQAQNPNTGPSGWFLDKKGISQKVDAMGNSTGDDVTNTPEQRVRLKEGIPVNELTPFQKKQVYRFAISMYFEQFANDVVDKAKEQVTVAQTTNSHFFSSPYGAISFGQSSELKASGTPNFATLLAPGATFSSGTVIQSSISRPAAEHEPKPTPEDAEQKRLAQSEALFFKPLAAQIELLQTRLWEESKTEATVDTAVRERPIAAFGEKNTSARALLTTYAKLCGLRIVDTKRPDAKNLVLRRPLCLPTSDLKEAMLATRQALPPSLIAALHLPELDTIRDTSADYTAKVRLAKQQEDTAALARLTGEVEQWKKDYRAKTTEWQDSPTTRYKAAMQKLQTFLRSSKEQRLPVTSLPLLERSAFAVAMLCPVMDAADGLLSNRLPIYIERFDDLVIEGGPTREEDGTVMFGFGVGFWRGEPRKISVIFGMSSAGTIE